jgi:RHS repeat-associated protein
LGSVSIATDSTGGVISYQKFDPWGKVREGGIGETTLNYTGQKLDGTGLLFYNARYYDPNIGKFVSADTIIPNLANPQALNRYAYVYNNPLRYRDPSGHCPSCNNNMHDDGGGGTGSSGATPVTPEPAYAPDPGDSYAPAPVTSASDYVPDPGYVSDPPLPAETPGERSAPFPGESAPLPAETPGERSAPFPSENPAPEPSETPGKESAPSQGETGSGDKINIEGNKAHTIIAKVEGGVEMTENHYHFHFPEGTNFKELLDGLANLFEVFESVEINFKSNGIEVKTGPKRLPSSGGVISPNSGGGNVPPGGPGLHADRDLHKP